MGRAIWSVCRPDLTPARGYLVDERQCALPPTDGDFRYHPNLRHSAACTGPALVGRVTDALTRESLSLHMTWKLRSPAPDPARKLLAGHRKKGGVIRQWPDEAVMTALGVAEGVRLRFPSRTPSRPCGHAGSSPGRGAREIEGLVKQVANPF